MPFKSSNLYCKMEKRKTKQSPWKRMQKTNKKNSYIFNGLIKCKCQMFSLASIYSKKVGIFNKMRSLNIDVLFKFVWMFRLNLNSNSIFQSNMRNGTHSKCIKTEENWYKWHFHIVVLILKHFLFPILNSLTINWTFHIFSHSIYVYLQRAQCSFHLIFNSTTNK